MKKKIKKAAWRSRKLNFFLIVLALMGLSVASFFILTRQDDSKDSIQVLKGRVTKKQTSCGLEILSKDGTPERKGGICDGGNYLTVDDITISTGGGSLGEYGNRPYYITNITNIHAGDRVEVGYVVKQGNHKSTNCSSCYVKKIGSFHKEPQQVVQKPSVRNPISK